MLGPLIAVFVALTVFLQYIWLRVAGQCVQLELLSVMGKATWLVVACGADLSYWLP